MQRSTNFSTIDRRFIEESGLGGMPSMSRRCHSFCKGLRNSYRRLDQVLTRFEEANLKLKPSKCKFSMNEVSYLGFKTIKDGLKPDPSKTEAIVNMPAPKNKCDVLRFLCMMG